MASMTTTSNPQGRWWHPLPLTSGIGLMLGMIMMKAFGGWPEFSWWFVIIFPLVSDVIVNLLIVGICAFGWWIADTVEKHRRKK
ncbi:MAG: hypothetical protein IJZ68_08135 [Bacteroidaceae bacterium]|nr:hypothetical protein [Bacteroidaceae bacterium]